MALKIGRGGYRGVGGVIGRGIGWIGVIVGVRLMFLGRGDAIRLVLWFEAVNVPLIGLVVGGVGGWGRVGKMGGR